MKGYKNEKNVVDLRVGKVSVGSVVSRLNRWQDDIESMTVVISWKNGITNVAGVGQDLKKYDDAERCYHSVVLQSEILNKMK